MSDLKPCPVPGCRSTDLDDTTIMDRDRELYRIECNECGIALEDDVSPECAAIRWNNLPRTEWISVEERLPEEYVWVLGTNQNQCGVVVGAAFLTPINHSAPTLTRWRTDANEGWDVTHWQPLPAPPEDA